MEFLNEISMPLAWLIIAIILGISEIATMGLTTVWFCGGAIVAFILALLDVSLAVQIVAFIVTSVVLLVFTRKILVEKLKTGKQKTNIEAIIGQTATVTKRITEHDTGEVRIGGKTWMASSNTEKEKGSIVKIKEVKGVTLIVE